MKILVTNDDGIHASGLRILVEKALKFGEVTVVAPAYEQSAKSHALNIRKGLAYQKMEDIVPGVDTYALESTPADCVRFAEYYLKLNYDIVFSGMNNGYNVGEDILYSGTVGAASEGVLCHKKAIAISAAYNKQMDAQTHLEGALSYIFDNKLFDICSFYNVNIPPFSNGIKITRQGSTHFEARFELEGHLVFQRGKPYFDRDNEFIESDVNAIHNHFISISPLSVDRTDFQAYQKLVNSK
ncbi:MAG: 5'/3'-nucleotidase SurE [Bacilli bacterium]|jgi:5'-nucleotidase|nr:5'/3'-nucleotidase SurE [Bacilli bacterium]MDY0064403.1 5'/3'-nucleotidase SurE [Bacilli bacterium]